MLLDMPRRAVLASLINKMETGIGWRSYREVAPAVFLLQNLTGVPLGYEYSDLFRRGAPVPFHKEMSLFKDLASMVYKDYLISNSNNDTYPDSYALGEFGARLLWRYGYVVEDYASHTDFVAERFSDMNYGDLGLTCYALWVTLAAEREGVTDVDARVDRYMRDWNLKWRPHAVERVMLIDDYRRRWANRLNAADQPLAAEGSAAALLSASLF